MANETTSTDGIGAFNKSKRMTRTPPGAGTQPGAGALISSCQSCMEPDTNEMVMCDHCDLWFHFRCANVTSSVEHEDWSCASCRGRSNKNDTQQSQRDTTNASNLQHEVQNNDQSFVEADRPTKSKSKQSKSIKSMSSRRKRLEMQKLEEEMSLKTKMMKEYLDKKYALLNEETDESIDGDDEKLEEASQIDHLDRINQWIEQSEKDCGISQPNTGTKPKISPFNNTFTANVNTKPSKSSTTMKNLKASQPLPPERGNQTKGKIDFRNVVSSSDNQGKIQAKCDINVPLQKVLSKSDKKNSSYHQPSQNNQNATSMISHNLSTKNHTISNPSENANSTNKQQKSNLNENSLNILGNQHNKVSQLTQSQITARHVVPKELPSFSGQPEDWPMFISSFEGSTRICGFTDDENLMRLQRCLKGKALDAVRCRMYNPCQVKEVIATLRLLFGRPELIIQNLLHKIKSEPAPKADKLESLIEFSLAVQNLCATIEAANLRAHLNNPCLIQELQDKMPPAIKLDWAKYKRNLDCEVTLSDFSTWLEGIALDANEVTLVNLSTPIKNDKPRNTKNNENSVNVHDTLPQSSKQYSSIENPSSAQDLSSSYCKICKGQCTSVTECVEFKKLSNNKKWSKVKDLKLCRTCLDKHKSYRCKSYKECGINGCKYKHHELLHSEKSIDTNPNPTNGNVIPSSQTSCHTHTSRKNPILFRILPVTLYGKLKTINTFAFLDDGSSITLIEDRLASSLGLTGESEPLYLKWTANTHRVESESKMVALDISALQNDNKKFKISTVRTVKSLDLPMQSLNMDEFVTKYPHLENLPVKSFKDAVPGILIGLDNWKLGLSLKYKEGDSEQPVASKTRLGWCVYGPHDHVVNSVNFHHNLHICDCQQAQNDSLHNMVKDYFAIESLGVIRSSKCLESEESKRAQLIMENTTKRNGNQYETGLLWRYDTVQLPSSYGMAKRRLECLEKRLSRDPWLKDIMENQLKDYIAKNYARKLESAEAEEHDSRTWYLPIFPVINPKKPEKVRMVWDAAAKVSNMSLNSQLLKGPDQTALLLGVLYRFREGKFAICADICEMFHQILIRKDDQNAQRFLWRGTNGEIEKYVMNVMTFGATCSPSSAQFVKNKNAREFENRFPRAVRAIINNHYVDDLLDSVDTDEEALALFQNVVSIHKNAGFSLHNCVSNSQLVMARCSDDVKQDMKNLNLSTETATEKILGMWWCVSTDEFTFNVSMNQSRDILNCKRRPTKREILRVMMTVFDPMGFLANFMIGIKILLQEVWKSSIGWDEEINDLQYEKWFAWVEQLLLIETVKIPRWHTFNSKLHQKIQLHLFVDASESAYAAVAYFRIESNNEIHCSLIGAKTRVAPMKIMSIPRLELESAVLGTRLASTIIENHSIDIHHTFFWTDSKTVIAWLKSDHRRYKQFIAFRVGEILEATEVNQWNWVPSKLNAADEATKTLKNFKTRDTSQWFRGPDFLYLEQDQWPSSDDSSSTTTEEELRPHLHHQDVSLFNDNSFIDKISCWKRLLKVQAIMTRFIFNARAKKLGLPLRIGYLSQEELKDSEKTLIKIAQHESYPDEIAILKKQKDANLNKQSKGLKSSPLYSHNPYLDSDGILRAYGRIDQAVGIELDTKRPILMPRDHHITRLLIKSFHEKYHHHNFETVVNEIHQRYAIPKLRAAIKREAKSCQQCKITRAKPQPPMMGQLPQARLATFQRPFSFIGIDYFGPILVTVGRRTEKRWGVLITCLTVRAVHIEIAHSLSTNSCILCLRSFIARRGTPIEIYSDQGTNFKGAEVELQEALRDVDQNELMKEFTTPNTKWVFNPPSCPHMGGSWERLVRSVKTTLYKIAPNRNVSDEVLKSMLAEVENVINSRPLTYLPVESAMEEALTPNHFLLGSSNGSKPLTTFSDDKIVLKKSWMTAQAYANRFWKRWIQEYLPTLTRRSKWFDPAPPITEGDIVIVMDENSPRNCWPKGRILKVVKGKDGQVRRATVQTASGIYERPAVKLAVLDVKPVDDGKSAKEDLIPGGNVTDASTSSTPGSN